MDEQQMRGVLVAWQGGEFGYREAMDRTGARSLFELYELARRSDVPLRRDLLPREERAVELATRDLLTAGRLANTHDVTERFKSIMHRLQARTAARGLTLDVGDVALRRRAYRAARRIEEARARRGDTRPFPYQEPK